MTTPDGTTVAESRGIPGAGSWVERPFRLPDVDPSSFSPEQHEAVNEMARFLHLSQIAGPFRVWLRNPMVMNGIMLLIKSATYPDVLDKRLARLVAITIAREYGAQFEWFIQSAFAVRDGLAPDIIEEIRVGRTPSFRNEDERIVHRATVELIRVKEIAEETFSRARELFGDDGVAELVIHIGVFTMVGMHIKALDMKAPAPFDPDPMPAIEKEG